MKSCRIKVLSFFLLKIFSLAAYNILHRKQDQFKFIFTELVIFLHQAIGCRKYLPLDLDSSYTRCIYYDDLVVIEMSKWLFAGVCYLPQDGCSKRQQQPNFETLEEGPRGFRHAPRVRHKFEKFSQDTRRELPTIYYDDDYTYYNTYVRLPIFPPS